MKRAVKLTLKFITAAKRKRIGAVLRRYRAAVNFYIDKIWYHNGKFDAETLRLLVGSPLAYQYKACALKQAQVVVSAAHRKAMTPSESSCPWFRGGISCSRHLLVVEKGTGIFDTIIRVSSLVPRARITLSTKATAILRKWLSVPGAKLIKGGYLCDDCVILWIDVPNLPEKKQGKVIGIDIGINKLIVTSEGEKLGTDFKEISAKICRRQPGSRSRQRAHRERENLINRVLNRLPWGKIRVIGVERLKNLKNGKKPNRSKAFRKAVSPWTYRQVLTRIKHKAQENRVRLVEVDPANTSRTCPKCSHADKNSRKGENFRCVSCGYQEDADFIGATNVLAKTLETLGSLESPKLKKST